MLVGAVALAAIVFGRAVFSGSAWFVQCNPELAIRLVRPGFDVVRRCSPTHARKLVMRTFPSAARDPLHDYRTHPQLPGIRRVR